MAYRVLLKSSVWRAQQDKEKKVIHEPWVLYI